jgi:hypothetical protein
MNTNQQQQADDNEQDDEDRLLNQLMLVVARLERHPVITPGGLSLVRNARARLHTILHTLTGLTATLPRTSVINICSFCDVRDMSRLVSVSRVLQHVVAETITMLKKRPGHVFPQLAAATPLCYQKSLWYRNNVWIHFMKSVENCSDDNNHKRSHPTAALAVGINVLHERGAVALLVSKIKSRFVAINDQQRLAKRHLASFITLAWKLAQTRHPGICDELYAHAPLLWFPMIALHSKVSSLLILLLNTHKKTHLEESMIIFIGDLMASWDDSPSSVVHLELLGAAARRDKDDVLKSRMLKFVLGADLVNANGQKRGAIVRLFHQVCHAYGPDMVALVQSVHGAALLQMLSADHTMMNGVQYSPTVLLVNEILQLSA